MMPGAAFGSEEHSSTLSIGEKKQNWPFGHVFPTKGKSTYLNKYNNYHFMEAPVCP